MKIVGVIAFLILIIWLGIKFHDWDDEKNDGCGCAIVTVVSSILIFVLMALSTCKSCISSSNNSPSYDYYDDRAR